LTALERFRIIVSLFEIGIEKNRVKGKCGLKMRHTTIFDELDELDNLTTKIITLLEFLNFASEVSRLQYE
jgi:hypothetical protein